MVNHCVVRGCTFKYTSRKRSSETEDVSLHRFPGETRKRALREAWIKAVRREGWQPTKHSAICSQHFLPEDMDYTGQTRRLREGVIPSVFPSFPKTNMEQERTGGEEEEEELPSCSVMLNTIKEEDNQDELDTTATHIENHIDIKEEILFPMHFAAIKTESQDMEDEVNEESYGYTNDFGTKDEYSVDMSMTFKTEIQVEKEDIGDEIKQGESFKKKDITKERRICSKSNSDSFKISHSNKSHRDFQRSCSVSKKQLQRKCIVNEHFVRCTICNRMCPNKNKLDVHMRMHTGERPYTCTICNKAYRQKSHLNHHLESHAESQRYNCVICKKLFFQKCNLNRHMILHSKQKDFHCDQCDKTFFKKVSLKNHIAIHSNDRQYICDICNKSFIWKSNLNNHKRIHSEKKPFNCDVCKKSFSHKSNFNKHMTVHNDSRPFACKVCIKSFCRKDSLKKHMLKHSGERPFLCHVCNKTFAQKCILNMHIRRHLRDTVQNIS